jgi:hypothetical protein
MGDLNEGSPVIKMGDIRQGASDFTSHQAQGRGMGAKVHDGVLGTHAMGVAVSDIHFF